MKGLFLSTRTGLRQSVMCLALLLLTLASIEGIALLGSHWLQAKSYFFYEPAFPSYDSFLRVHDPLLGWAAGHADDMVWDTVGSRVIPAFPNPLETQPLISLYGDSWTWSWPVDAEQAYSNVLAALLGDRVHNFGICGYGTDQAYLRFATNRIDTAPIVVLGVLSENILRNVTGFLDLINPASGYGLKPRFTLGPERQLEYVPPISLSRLEFRPFLENPEWFCPDDYFAPYSRSHAGVARIEFPYSLSLTRVVRGYRFRAAIQGRPRWAEFYNADHPSGALQVTVEIITRFVEDATIRGKRPLVVMIPTGEDLAYFRSHQRWTYRPLLDELESRGLGACHIGPGILSALGEARITQLFTEGCLNEHPNALGYAVQAKLVYQCLREQMLIPTGSARESHGLGS